MAAIFDLSPIRTSGILRNTSVVLPDLENIGITVGISLLSCILTELHLIPCSAAILDFWLPVSSDSISDGANEKFTLENIGLDTGIVFLSRRIAELLGGGNFTTPPWSALQNSVRCPRVNDYICGRLSIIINSHIRNSVDQTSLDCEAFLMEFILIRDRSLPLSGLLFSDELNIVISQGLVGFLVCLCSCCIMHFVYDLIIKNRDYRSISSTLQIKHGKIIFHAQATFREDLNQCMWN